MHSFGTQRNETVYVLGVVSDILLPGALLAVSYLANLATPR